MKIDEEKKEVKEKGFLASLGDNKLVLLHGILIIVSLLAAGFYNPYFVFFSLAHWIVFLSFIVIGAFFSFVIYYKNIFPIYRNLFYSITVTMIASFVVGSMIDSSMKDVTLSETTHFKAAGSTKISIRGKIRNSGSMSVQKCELSVTARAGVDPDSRMTVDPKNMFTPSVGFDFSFKTSLFDPDRYWSQTEKVVILDEYFPEGAISYFSRQLDFGKSVSYPIVSYHLSCQ